MVSPRRPGGAIWAVNVAPSTVSTAKPAPRSTDTTRSHHRSWLNRYSGDGAPNEMTPKMSTAPVPNRFTNAGTSSCTITVHVSMAVVTVPATPTETPLRAAHDGRADNVAKKLEIGRASCREKVET